MFSDNLEKYWERFARTNPRGYIYANPDATVESLFFESGKKEVDDLLAIFGDFDRCSAMLEVGCGLGRMTRHFAPLFANVYAVDVSSTMVEMAREKNKHLSNVQFSKCDGGGNLRFANNAMDFVVSWCVMQHITRGEVIKRYIHEIARVMRPGGRCIINFDTRTNTIPSLLLRRLPPFFDPFLSTTHKYGMRRVRRSHSLISKRIYQAGLTVVSERSPATAKNVFLLTK